MDQRKKIIMIVVGVLVLVAFLFLWLRGRDRGEAVPTPTTSGGVGAVNAGALVRSGGVGDVSLSVASPPPPPADVAVQQLAATFAERYGSFSAEGNFVNITDLYPLATERYRRTLEQVVARGRASAKGGDSVATTTQVIAVRATIAADGDTASASVSTQRSEARYGRTTRTYPQRLTMQFIRTGDAWRVDGATWD
ncbi:hypothetical protein HY480_03910 [Candidatus Uhrbacteria bacterium]|nr:hypothetical protein [Candidatus Uhrbacteria bacterium]